MYPYAGGAIGVYGYDLLLSALKYPTQADIMGYCNNDWISDYNYKGIMSYRQAHPFVFTSADVARPGLLVWGRIEAGHALAYPSIKIFVQAQ